MNDKIRLFLLNKKIKLQNPLSKVELERYFDSNRLKIGKYTYGKFKIISFNNTSKIKIGNFCSIAQDVVFIVDAEHSINRVSTYPFMVKLFNECEFEALSKGNIVIDDDVWIGYGAKIMSGVHIGQGAVIAAGAVVTKNVPPYAVVGGIPAQIKKYRFDRNVVDFLLTLDFSAVSEMMLKKHCDILYLPINNKPINEIIKMFNWFPKKYSYRNTRTIVPEVFLKEVNNSK